MMILHGDAKVMAAFVAARKEIGATVGKDRKGNYGSYATLAALTEATTDALAKQGCAIVQEASLNDDGVLVETWLIHESGGMLQFTPLLLPVKDRTAQAVGSAITYARRYALAAVCGIAPDDDDGEAATHGKPQAQRQQPKSAPPVQPQASAQVQHVESFLVAWANPDEAMQWAVDQGASENIHAARTAFKRLVEERFDGKLTKGNLADAYRAWYDDRMAKLARPSDADAVQEKFDAPTPQERGALPATPGRKMAQRMAAN